MEKAKTGGRKVRCGFTLSPTYVCAPFCARKVRKQHVWRTHTNDSPNGNHCESNRKIKMKISGE